MLDSAIIETSNSGKAIIDTAKADSGVVIDTSFENFWKSSITNNETRWMKARVSYCYPGPSMH